MDTPSSEYSSSDFSEIESDEDEVDCENEFQFEKKQKNAEHLQFILSCLKNHFIFYNLTESELENVAKKMYYCSLPGETIMFKEGSQSKWFFIIEKGSIEILTTASIKQQLRVGDGFGEIGLIYKTQRNFSVRTVEDCTLWGISRVSFRRAIEEIILEEFLENKLILQSIPFFHSLTLEQKQMIAGSFICQNYEVGQTIVEEGEPGSFAYIIKSGKVSMWNNGNYIKSLQKTQFFGLKALFYNIKRQTTVSVDEKTSCLILSREMLVKQLGNDIFNVTFRNFMRKSLENTEYLSRLSQIKKEKILDMMKITAYKPGNTIIKQESDEEDNMILIIVIEGIISKAKDPTPLAIESQVYGQQSLLSNVEEIVEIDDDIIMQTNGILAEIKTSLVREVIGGHLNLVVENQFIKSRQEVEKKMKNRMKPIESLDELVIIKELDGNCFGPEFIIGWQKRFERKKIFQLKSYNINKVEEHKFYDYLHNENQFFQVLCHPFIIEQYKTFKDSNYLYSVREFVRGENLYYAIREIGLLSTSDAKFYISCIILVMEYLLQESVFLRDMSPENFMIDDKGYIKLISIATAKKLAVNNCNYKTKTLIGSPYYSAPEMIEGKGYNYTSSLFGLGVLLFEFMCGYVPFGEKSDDPIEIYEDIMSMPLKFPKLLRDEKAKKLMIQLLNKDYPQTRMGGPNFESLKNNPWFYNVEWDLLERRKLGGPIYEMNLNIIATEEQLEEQVHKGQNLEQFLSERFPLRSLQGKYGQQTKFWNW